MTQKRRRDEIMVTRLYAYTRATWQGPMVKGIGNCNMYITLLRPKKDPFLQICFVWFVFLVRRVFYV